MLPSFTKLTPFKRWLVILIFALILLIGWLLTTNNANVWPVRNTIQYHLLRAWWARSASPAIEGRGILSGTVTTPDGSPITGARVLVTRWNGHSWSARSHADGTYVINHIPAGSYYPVAGAPDRENVSLGRVRIKMGAETIAEITLPPAVPRSLPPANNLTIGQASQLSCQEPLERRAIRRELSFTSHGQASQATFLYTPISATVESTLPTLLAVYPGPVESWECVSIPLAAADYAVLGIGPAYSLDLEGDIDQIQQLLGLAREGQLPNVDGTRLAALGGSYSALLVQRLLQRDQNINASLLLGPPTDLFDIRRRFEKRTFTPPFGLDQVLIALGFPDQEPLRYWTYSGAYHIHPNMPPTAIFHSRSDNIVPYQQSQQLANALAQEGIEHELHLFDGGNHYLLSADEDALEIYRLTLDFLARQLR
jgi:acetyl esterase/lipase